MRNDVLDQVESKISDAVVRSFHVTEIYDPEYLVQQVAKEIFETLPRHQRLRIKLKSPTFPTPFGSAGAGMEHPFNRPIDRLQRIAERTPTETVVFVYDIHSLSEDKETTQAQLEAIAEVLPPNVTLVTAGEYILEASSVEIEPLSKEVFVSRLTEELNTISIDRATEIYDAVDGMPLYLGLILETHATDETVDGDRIAEEATQLIEDYVTSLSDDEQQFLRKSAVLLELDEHMCHQLMDISAVEAASTLQELHDKLAIRKVGRRDGVARYKIRDDIRHYLYTHTADAQRAHQQMFEYYLEELLANDSDGLFDRVLYPGLPCCYHLKGSVRDDQSVTTVRKRLESLDLSLEERIEICFSLLPMFGFREPGMEPVLFEMLNEVREEMDQRYPDEVDLSEVMGIDGYRIGYRLLFAKKRDEQEQVQEFYSEAAAISESVLQDIAAKADEDTEIGMWVVTFHLAAAYAYMNCGKKGRAHKHLDPVLQKVERFGIPRSVVVAAYLRTKRLHRQLDLDNVIKELLMSEMDQTFDAVSEQDSLKQFLFDAQGNFGPAITRAGFSFFEELSAHPRLLTRYIDDMVVILSPSDEELGRENLHAEMREFGDQLRQSIIQIVLPLVSQYSLYKLCYSTRFSPWYIE
ncbi:hypothetical protein [Halomicrobium salinisoli]|uniref:hypothetical protein n=1 Tax=Halomicrobium salinisoli TaxID=2878391 RepID=UPI001CF0461F|nr:hypothetical protein [Halomicrobium salinisoli]